MIKKLSNKTFLFYFFCFALYSISMQTDAPRYVEQASREFFDLGNGRSMVVQKNGYFIEDEHGNVFYTEKSKTQFIEKPDYLEGGSKVVYEESSSIDHFLPAARLESQTKPDLNVANEPAGEPSDWENQALSARRDNFCREFSRDVSNVFNTIRAYSAWNSVPHPIDKIPFGIGEINCYHPGGKNRFIQQFSMYQIVGGAISVRADYEHLIKKFCKDVIGKHTNMYVNWSSPTASLNTLSRLEHTLDTHKKLKKKALNDLKDVFGENYLNLFINTYKLDLKERLRIERFDKARVLERSENKRLGEQNAGHELVAREAVEKLARKLSEKLLEAVQQVGADEKRNETLEVVGGEQKKQWLEAELKLQQQEGEVLLDEEQLKTLEDMRCYLDKTKHVEASRAYLSMLKQAEIEQYQNNGKISKKLYNRLIAAHVAINNKFERKAYDYILNNYAHRFIPQEMCDVRLLERCSGNAIQHNVHGEIVALVNRYSYYLHANRKDISGDGPNLYEAANIALDMKSRLDGEEVTAKTKIYESTYSFLDFCHNLLKVKVGQTALNLWLRFGKGLELGGVDVQRAFQSGLKGCFAGSSLDGDNLLSEILDGQKSLETILEKQQAGFENKRKELGDSITNLFERVISQPLEDTVGDALEFLSRKLVQTSAVIMTALGIAAVAEAGVASAVGIGGLAAGALAEEAAIAAKKMLEPFVMGVTADGTAVLDKAVSSGVSVCQSIVNSLSQAIQTLCGMSEAANNLCFVSQGFGNEGRPKPFVMQGDKGESAGRAGERKSKGKLDSPNFEDAELISEVKELGANKINHIMQSKHNWKKVVADSNDWGQVARVINRVMNEGIEEVYKRDFKKVWKVFGEVVEVTYRKMSDGTIKISNGWVI